MAEKKGNQDLTPRQRRALAALLTSRDVKAAAEASGVGARTLYRWLDLPAFRAALAAAEGDAIDQATRNLITLTQPAIGVITQTMRETNPAAVRLRAAQSVLDYLLKLRELRNVEERLEALEKAVLNGDGRKAVR